MADDSSNVGLSSLTSPLRCRALGRNPFVCANRCRDRYRPMFFSKKGDDGDTTSRAEKGTETQGNYAANSRVLFLLKPAYQTLAAESLYALYRPPPPVSGCYQQSLVVSFDSTRRNSSGGCGKSMPKFIANIPRHSGISALSQLVHLYPFPIPMLPRTWSRQER